jgi:long-chain acyl-CoA synthetase
MGAARYPEEAALRFGEDTWTYAELDAAANRVAGALRDAGVAAGDRVGLYLPNSLTFPAAYFGALKTGAVAVPLNLRRPLDGLAFVAEDAGLSALVGAGDHEGTVTELAREAGVGTVLVPGASDPEAVDYDAAVADASPEFDRPGRGYRDQAVMLYTSGTTGEPKGVPLTHENLLTAVDSMAKSGYYVPVDPDSSVLVAIPLFHAAGLNALLGVYLYRGGTVVILDSADPGDMLAAIERYGIQNLGGVPTLYTTMNELYQQSPDEYDLSSLEVVAASGANLPEATRRALHEDWEVVITEGWGMTETAPSGTFQPHRGVRKAAGCVGPPMYGFTLKLVDPRTREDVVPAEHFEPHVDIRETGLDFGDRSATTGEIAVRGPQVFEGYHERPELTARAFDDDGWFFTKDVARVDEDGYLWIVDRVDDMLRCGGENVYPAEVEDALHEHPDVVEAAVVGVAHETKGEAPVAFVVRRDGADLAERALRKFTLDRVPSYAHPRRVFFVEDLPKSATAKVQRFKLEDEAAARLDGPLEPSEEL